MTERCPICFSQIETDQTKVVELMEQGIIIWYEDPLPTPMGLAGELYVGRCPKRVLHIKQLQEIRKQQEIEMGVTPLTEFLPITNSTSIKLAHIIQLRQSTEKILGVTETTTSEERTQILEQYFNFDEDGTDQREGHHQVEWIDKDLLKVNAIKAIHIEDLRHSAGFDGHEKWRLSGTIYLNPETIDINYGGLHNDYNQWIVYGDYGRWQIETGVEMGVECKFIDISNEGRQGKGLQIKSKIGIIDTNEMHLIPTNQGLMPDPDLHGQYYSIDFTGAIESVCYNPGIRLSTLNEHFYGNMPGYVPKRMRDINNRQMISEIKANHYHTYEEDKFTLDGTTIETISTTEELVLPHTHIIEGDEFEEISAHTHLSECALKKACTLFKYSPSKTYKTFIEFSEISLNNASSSIDFTAWEQIPWGDSTIWKLTESHQSAIVYPVLSINFRLGRLEYGNYQDAGYATMWFAPEGTPDYIFHVDEPNGYFTIKPGVFEYALPPINFLFDGHQAQEGEELFVSWVYVNMYSRMDMTNVTFASWERPHEKWQPFAGGMYWQERVLWRSCGCKPTFSSSAVDADQLVTIAGLGFGQKYNPVLTYP